MNVTDKIVIQGVGDLAGDGDRMRKESLVIRPDASLSRRHCA